MIGTTTEKILSWEILNLFMCKQMIMSCDVFTDRCVNKLMGEEKRKYLYILKEAQNDFLKEVVSLSLF